MRRSPLCGWVSRPPSRGGIGAAERRGELEEERLVETRGVEARAKGGIDVRELFEQDGIRSHGRIIAQSALFLCDFRTVFRVGSSRREAA